MPKRLPQRNQLIRTVVPPIGGINVRDAINGMPTGDALNLVNWIPQQYGVRTRKGYREWAINLDSPVRTIMQYQPDQQVLTDYKLWAVTDGNIFDVTSATDAPVSSLTLAGTNEYGRFASVMMTNTTGPFLLACSHEGGYYTYDGAAWVHRAAGAGAGQINGINPDNLCYVTTFKSRVWFIEKGTTNAWYLDTDAISGTATKFPLGPFVKHGGKLAWITNWTIDAGEGIDDLLVFGFEGGDILIYKGTNPASASTFALVGSFYVGAMPVGRRGVAQYGGDVLVLAELGLQPLSYVTRGGQSILRVGSVDYLAKIQPRIADLISQSSRQNGWDLQLFARDNMLIVSVPATTSNVYNQYVLNTNTNAWCMFQGVPMICGAVANNQFWIGTEDGRVCLAFSGYFDEVKYDETVGLGISGLIQPSFSYFGVAGANKQFKMVRPTFLAADKPGVFIDIVVDFQYRDLGGVPAVPESPSGSRWNVGIWDDAVWGGALQTFADWYGAESVGYAAAANIVTNCVGDTFLASLDYLFEVGGPL